MAQKISQLEQDWLAAETIADQLRAEAIRADAELERFSAKADRQKQPEIRVLLGEVEDLHARHAAAERAASEAFDRLWSAKEQHVSNAGN